MAAPEKPVARQRDTAPTLSIKRADRRQVSLPLVLAAVPGVDPSLSPVIPLRQLWLGICLPTLPLEAVVGDDAPAAVFEEQKGVRKILMANRSAMAQGIRPELTINAALALSPALQLEERNLVREARVLEELAVWSEKFTSFTVIERPSVLLLEIAGSLTLFGGIRALRQRIVQGLLSHGFHAEVAIAPTPLAATWLARAGQKVCIRDSKNLVGKLGPLPLTCLNWPDAVTLSLRGMGVTTVAELLRLPRQGFAKRFGAARLLALDRALGKLPDPRVSYRGSEPFFADFDLNEEQDNTKLLLNACRELLVRLERFLLGRQTAVQQIEFSFFHFQRSATRLGLGCAQADRAVQHWFDLLEIKFDRLTLPAPVIAIRLCAGQGQSFTTTTETLPFSSHDKTFASGSITHLAERLSAHIGDESVHGVMTVAEHRPQYAWQVHYSYDEVPNCQSGPVFRADPHAPELLADIRRTNSLVLQRPLWVLQEPALLDNDQAGPCYHGPLRLQAGPERLETGWWDDTGIARDYYVAVNPRGVHLWIYRDRSRATAHWYLHGMFG